MAMLADGLSDLGGPMRSRQSCSASVRYQRFDGATAVGRTQKIGKVCFLPKIPRQTNTTW